MDLTQHAKEHGLQKAGNWHLVCHIVTRSGKKYATKDNSATAKGTKNPLARTLHHILQTGRTNRLLQKLNNK